MKIIEVHAMDINPYDNRSRKDILYITLSKNSEEAINKVKKKHTEASWKFTTEIIEEEVYLIDGWEE